MAGIISDDLLYNWLGKDNDLEGCQGCMYYASCGCEGICLHPKAPSESTINRLKRQKSPRWCPLEVKCE